MYRTTRTQSEDSSTPSLACSSLPLSHSYDKRYHTPCNLKPVPTNACACRCLSLSPRPAPTPTLPSPSPIIFHPLPVVVSSQLQANRHQPFFFFRFSLVSFASYPLSLKGLGTLNSRFCPSLFNRSRILTEPTHSLPYPVLSISSTSFDFNHIRFNNRVISNSNFKNQLTELEYHRIAHQA